MTLREVPEGDPARDMIDRMHYLRGQALGSFAHVEYILGDFCERVRPLPEYSGASATLPYAFDTRVARVRAMCQLPGPLEPYREPLDQLLSDIEQWAWFRHHMAHGFLRLEATSDRQAHQIRSLRYLPTKSEPYAKDIRLMNLNSFALAAADITTITGRAFELFEQIYSELKL